MNYLDTSIPNENINNRMKYYDSVEGKGEIKLFINIGGGVYAIGVSIERNLVPPGIIYPGDIDSKKGQSVVYEFLNREIPVININHIQVLADWYDLESPPRKTFESTKGSLFYSKKQYRKMVFSLHIEKFDNWPYSSPTRYVNSFQKNEIPIKKPWGWVQTQKLNV